MPDDEDIRAEVGECPAASDHETRHNVCIHCGAEFDEED